MCVCLGVLGSCLLCVAVLCVFVLTHVVVCVLMFRVVVLLGWLYVLFLNSPPSSPQGLKGACCYSVLFVVVCLSSFIF